ncbi:hypothetical protein BC939DRAFT_474677 [Gamsiella multidivaricata]|uniref:uncharacterized protein n=1 Tax=Gamsiella multidivaricata TaxID=101098 RepID=UPI002220F81F|nr:uncharacterized protein BC939DRAFT_474677 [Gamsiella multidivaricata]KAG0362005.1 hypothetical protein BGZ54_008819 [Gamsiella multidivaricata]KAI7828834.1 hypothetical protein BC939DRAFT_474677 [Gamsiella multidivaricata]
MAAQANETLTLTDDLRQKTKGHHRKMDRLVQLGLFTVLDYQIYRQILLGFYYVFRTFEEEYEKHTKGPDLHPWVAQAYWPDIRRTEAFEADLAYFYGDDWKEHVCPSKQMQEYMDHIRDISKKNPERLVAYPATLYLGIFFGGQITRSKIVKSTRFFPSPPDKKLGGEHDSGIAIFTFRERSSSSSSFTTTDDAAGHSGENGKLDPNKVKNDLKSRLNSIPGIYDQTDSALAARRAIEDEAKEIFVRNMDLFTSVEGVPRVWTRWIVYSLLYLAIAMAFYQILFSRFSTAAPVL